MNDATASHADYLKATHTEDTESTWPVARGFSESSGPGIRVPHNTHVPLAIGFTDRVAYQRLRNHNLIQRGSSLYDDQEIMFEGHVPIDILER